MTRVTNSPPVLWHLRKRGKTLTCAVRLIPAGLPLEQSTGTQRLVSQTFQGADELHAQADDSWAIPARVRQVVGRHRQRVVHYQAVPVTTQAQHTRERP